MKLIQDNPYRIAGLLANSSERELQRQKSTITRYASIGRIIDSELDFPFFDNIDRSEGLITKAFAGIEQNQDKVSHSLFWFLKTNTFDETAINYLINGDKEKAAEIWEKVTKGKEVTQKNYSSFNNVGTLKLLSESIEEIKEGIEAKIKLIESPLFADFVKMVADETYSLDNQKQIEKFVEYILQHFKGKYSSLDTFNLFSNCNGTTLKFLSQKFTEEPLHQIESQIESTKTKRKANRSNAYQLGLKLFTNCKSDLAILKSLLGSTDLRYKMIADDLAKEVMQCGIDYFQELKEFENPSEKVLKLLKHAKSIALGTQLRERIKQNIEGIQEWAETAPIKEDLNFVIIKLKNFQNSIDSIENAQSLLSSCKNKLQNIKIILGSTDEFYLNLSSDVVKNALGMIITVVNDAQSDLQHNRSKLLLLPSILSNAVSALVLMDSFDMNSQTRTRLSENKTTIINIKRHLDAITKPTPRQADSGCYIATMAYGNYDHPKVMELRKFRDTFLIKSYLGRKFIELYYKYSPLLVEKLKDSQKINVIIRILLDQLIKIIRN